MGIIDNPEKRPPGQASTPPSGEEKPVKRIFIVEDEDMVADNLQEMLTYMGYGIAGIVASGEEAIEQIPKALPDLVLMDIQLRGKMDGIEAARILLNGQLEIPIVYLTAHKQQLTTNRIQVTSPFGFIAKPFEKRELQIIVEIALYRSQVEAKLKKLNQDLQTALSQIDTLTRLLPICSWCKKVHNDQGNWEELEDYITSHSHSQLTHSICPKCANKFGLSPE